MKKFIIESSETIFYRIPVEIPDDFDGTAQDFLDTININYDDYNSGYDAYQVDDIVEVDSWDNSWGIDSKHVVK